MLFAAVALAQVGKVGDADRCPSRVNVDLVSYGKSASPAVLVVMQILYWCLLMVGTARFSSFEYFHPSP